MEDTSRNRALKISGVVSERGAGNVVCLDMAGECSWTSYLIVGTATSRVHMAGLAAAVRDEMKALDMESAGSRKKEDESWKIIDGGDVVVSLMDAEAREFYALEERWFEAEQIFNGSDSGEQE